MKKSIAVLLLTGACSFTAQAGVVSWTEWTSSLATSHVNGSLLVGTSSVSVTYIGPFYFAQMSGGENYWDPSTPYLSSTVSNAPPASDIIALYTGGSKTILFSQAVQDPLIALVSWNSTTVDFGVPIEILSFGQGYWGNGTPILNATGTGFYGSGEVHGVIKLPGVFTSITFTDSTESWHGFTVGIVGLAENGVPEPASLALLGIGFAALAGFRRRNN